MTSRAYIGGELELFSAAGNWKRYWSGLLRPYLGQRILDVGAGLGSTARALSDLRCEEYVSLEPDEQLFGQMQREKSQFNPAFEAVLGTLVDIDSSRKFDTILYIDVLEHIEHDRDELQDALARLAPGGAIVVLAPAHNWLFTEFDTSVGHFRRYDARSLRQAIPNGLELEQLMYLDSVGMFASLANRLLLRQGQPTPRQIKLWDGGMVPLSRTIDRILGYRVGKSLLAVLRASPPIPPVGQAAPMPSEGRRMQQDRSR